MEFKVSYLTSISADKCLKQEIVMFMKTTERWKLQRKCQNLDFSLEEREIFRFSHQKLMSDSLLANTQ